MDNRKNVLSKILWTLFSVALAYFTIRAVLAQSKTVTVGQLVDFILESDKVWFCAGVISAMLYVWFEGIAIRSILKDAGYDKSMAEGLVYSTSDVYFSAITPSATGGQPASAYFMIKDGVPVGVTSATLVLNLIMYNASIGILGIVAVILSPEAISQFGMASKFFIGFGIVVLTLLSLFFFMVLKRGDGVFSALHRLVLFLEKKRIIKNGEKAKERIKKYGEDYSDCSEMISGKPKLIAKAFIWNFLQRASQILVPMFLYLAAGGDGKRSVLVFSKQCLINIGYNFIPIPGAMGVSDYLMVDGFSSIMGEKMAFEIEMISRGITFYLCVALCGIFTLVGYIIRRAKNDRCI